MACQPTKAGAFAYAEPPALFELRRVRNRKRSRHSEASADSAGVICRAAKASGNGHGAYFGDGFGDREDPHGGFLFGGRPAAYGAGNVPFGERVRIDPHDFLHDETRLEEDHREGVERLHVPELARERPLPRRKSWSE
jgi:hypothetical protein